jgi:hypothetical protein
LCQSLLREVQLPKGYQTELLEAAEVLFLYQHCHSDHGGQTKSWDANRGIQRSWQTKQNK